LSVVAQLATFPLCLYYFGTFPTYFFVTNLLIIPLVTSITYAVGGIGLAKLLSLIMPDLSAAFYCLPVKILQGLVGLVTSIIRFFENLPFALVNDAKISFPDMILIYTLITGVLVFFIYKKPKGLILGLLSILLFFIVRIYHNVSI